MKIKNKMIQNSFKKKNNLRIFFILIFLFFFLIIGVLNYPNDIQNRNKKNNYSQEIIPSQSENIEFNSSNLRKFFDSYAPNYLEEWKMAGMTLSVVKNDSILFSKGYGYANLEEDIPVDSNKTTFNIGSISKLFTMTAVMQLVEKNVLDLNEDVNNYLSYFKIPYTFPEPITLHHLLTHTAGFDDTFYMNTVDENGNTLPFKDIVKNALPHRRWVPGTRLSYSNYGLSLAGYIIQEVSNLSFFDYINENIFKPLNMNFSSSTDPAPLELQKYMSNGYVYGKNTFSKYESVPQPTYGAGGVRATALDMSKFMINYLNNGEYNNSRILEEYTVQEIISRQFGYHSELPGMCLGFWEDFSNNFRSIIHTGDTQVFHSKLAFIPESKIGIFFSFNTYNPEKMGDAHTSYKLQEELYQAFWDYFFPKQPNNFSYIATNEQDLQKYVGLYRISVLPQMSVMKSVLMLFYGSTIFEITSNSNGTLNGQGKILYKIAPNLFQSSDGELMVYFIEDNNGQIAYAGVNISPTHTLEKLNWYETAEFHMFLLLFCLIIFCLTLISGFIIIIKRKIKKEQKYIGNLRKSRIIAGLGCLFNLILIGVYLVWLLSFNYSQSYYIFTMLLISLPIISLIFACIILIYTILAWTGKGSLDHRPYWKITGRIYYTILMITNFLFIYFLGYWHIFGF